MFGKPNTGKCLTGDGVVPTTTGSIVHVSNLHPGIEVFSVDENFRLVKDKIVAVASNQELMQRCSLASWVEPKARIRR